VKEIDMQKETRTVYIDDRGNEHTTEDAAIAADQRYANMKFFSLRYSPDLCEGRGFQKVMHLAIPANVDYIEAVDWANQFAAKKIGVPIVEFYGHGARNWSIVEITAYTWKNRTDAGVIGNDHFLVEKIEFDEEKLHKLI
jgi:hypothetical protein